MVFEPTDAELFSHSATLWVTPLPSPDPSTISESFCLNGLPLASGEPADKPPFMVFHKIMQPPGAMLMGGIKKWRHLQRYLVNLASRNEAVMTALWCLDTQLERDGICNSVSSARHHQNHIRNSFNTTTYLIQQDLSLIQCGTSSKIDYWLAALFLLAWSQVLCDRVEHNSESLFPTDLADIIITCSHDWNWYSRQLLSWFNSFDSKASHLGGPSLLSSKALHIVSQYPIQITSCNYEELKHRSESPDGDEDIRSISQTPLSGVSEHEDGGIAVPARSPCDLKEMVLKAILQSAAEWYLRTQACCRQISALDKHHCKRFTPDAEMKVAMEGKQIESKLWDLWAQCPSVICLSTAELSMSVTPDLATRVQEVSSVYLASFWILLVYLHRVCWWHLPHTEAVKDALRRTWEHMKNSYGERDSKIQQKTVHPALMWPVYLFGAECEADEQRSWAIEQLKALGRARPVLKSENQNLETLPEFRISHGATRNATRASLLLGALVQQQAEKNCRVDDRDLAMDMFNCYFTIV